MKREILLARVAVQIIRLLALTVRVKLDDKSGATNGGDTKGPILLTFWHNRIVGVCMAFLKYYPPKRRGVTVLTSPSKDGEILAGIMAGLGMGAVRGSSSRRGPQALRELIKLVEWGSDIAVTPDGPRGPKYKLGPGVIALAQLTGRPINPVHVTYSKCIRMKTWDEFIIPLPFSTVSVTVEPPIFIPREVTDTEFETLREKIQTILKNEAN